MSEEREDELGLFFACISTSERCLSFCHYRAVHGTYTLRSHIPSPALLPAPVLLLPSAARAAAPPVPFRIEESPFAAPGAVEAGDDDGRALQEAIAAATQPVGGKRPRPADADVGVGTDPRSPPPRQGAGGKHRPPRPPSFVDSGSLGLDLSMVQRAAAAKQAGSSPRQAGRSPRSPAGGGAPPAGRRPVKQLSKTLGRICIECGTTSTTQVGFGLLGAAGLGAAWTRVAGTGGRRLSSCRSAVLPSDCWLPPVLLVPPGPSDTCATTGSPALQWRSQGLLCNSCGVKLIKGRLPMDADSMHRRFLRLPPAIRDHPMWAAAQVVAVAQGRAAAAAAAGQPWACPGCGQQGGERVAGPCGLHQCEACTARCQLPLGGAAAVAAAVAAPPGAPTPSPSPSPGSGHKRRKQVGTLGCPPPHPLVTPTTLLQHALVPPFCLAHTPRRHPPRLKSMLFRCAGHAALGAWRPVPSFHLQQRQQQHPGVLLQERARGGHR